MKNVYVSDKLHKDLKLFAVTNGKSVSSVVENALQNYLLMSTGRPDVNVGSKTEVDMIKKMTTPPKQTKMASIPIVKRYDAPEKKPVKSAFALMLEQRERENPPKK